MIRQPLHKQLPLYHKIDKKQDEYTLCGFDIETKGLGGDFIIGGFYTEQGDFFTFTTMQDCFDFMILNPGYRYLAHNAAGYEFSYLYTHIVDYFKEHPDIDIQTTIQGDSRIVQFLITKPIEGKKKKRQTLLDIRDSYALFNASLSDVAKSFCPELPKGEPPWNKAHDNFDPSSTIWVEYLKRDCEIPVMAYRKHANTIWELFHCNLGVTAGSTAIRAFKTTIHEGHVYYRVTHKVEAFFRKAYYGAIVLPGHEVGNWGKTASVDVNAAYGYQMGIHEYGVGTPIHTMKYKEGYLGIYECDVNVPTSVFAHLGFNPIPKRTNKGLLWPTGTFRTHITSIEIEYARAKGIGISVLEGYYFTKTEPVFKEFIDTCQKLELMNNGQYKPSTKLLRNTAYGKFGSKSEHNAILFSHERITNKADDPCRIKPAMNEKTGQFIDNVYIKENEVVEADYIMPAWAAFITAWQRLYMFGFVEEAYKRGAKNVYVDTDSLKADYDVIIGMINDGILPMGNTYGQFKLEETAEECIVLAPKVLYMNGNNGETLKAKGMPYRILQKQLYMQALKNIRPQLEYDSVQNAMSLIKKGGGKIGIKRKRSITDLKHSYAWRLVDEKYIVPFSYVT